MWCLDGPPWACRCDYPPDIALGAAFRDHPGLAPLVRAPLSGTCVGWVTCTGAQQMKHSQLVGFTATTVTKDTDAIRMTNLCQTEVESEARICNSAEVTAAVSVTQSLPARQSAWVRRGSSPNSTAEVSVAIITNSDRKIRLICDGSPPPTNFQELTISDLLSLQECDSPHAIACCAPTTVPEPTKSQ